MKKILKEQIGCNEPINITIQIWASIQYVWGTFPYTIQDLVDYISPLDTPENTDTGYDVYFGYDASFDFNLPVIPISGDEDGFTYASLNEYGISNLGDLLNSTLNEPGNSVTELNSISWLEGEVNYSLWWGPGGPDPTIQYSPEEVQQMIDNCLTIFGCMDINATNYNPDATEPCEGCCSYTSSEQCPLEDSNDLVLYLQSTYPLGSSEYDPVKFCTQCNTEFFDDPYCGCCPDSGGCLDLNDFPSEEVEFACAICSNGGELEVTIFDTTTIITLPYDLAWICDCDLDCPPEVRSNLSPDQAKRIFNKLKKITKPNPEVNLMRKRAGLTKNR